MAKTKVESFINQFIAQIKGDDAKVKAEQNFRLAQSALKVQISLAEAKTVELEQNLENAKEQEIKALVNSGCKITSGENYVSNLVHSSNKVTEAEEELEEHQEYLQFLQQKLKDICKKEDPVVED